MTGARPGHHGPDGRFRNPWPSGAGDGETPPGGGAMLKWVWQRWRDPPPPDPRPDDLPRAEPDPARPRLAVASASEPAETRLTWIGHATYLIQLPGLNLLTDPIFGRRASPVSWAGPARFTPPGLEPDDLPPVDGVLISHDHYDHLDLRSVAMLHERFADALTWFTPLGYGPLLSRRGVERVVELDWWDEAWWSASYGEARVRALPARHWTRRRLRDTRRRLWCSWSVEAGGRRIYFGGDSGYGPLFLEMGERTGPFDAALLPIGAYEPRWFMRTSHMNPEEAVQASCDLGAREFVATHWGTFRLTDEAPLEPPARTRRAWSALGLAADNLHIPAHGETVILGRGDP